MSRSRLLMIAAVVVVAAQLIPIPRSNPPVEGKMPAPPEVQAILDRACADCHSHATRWPWYAYVAPVSWLVAYDTHEAREHLNFSTFGGYSLKRQRSKTKEIWEEVEEGEMPLWYYVIAHPEAKLSDADRQTLREFSAARAVELEGGRPGGG